MTRKSCPSALDRVRRISKAMQWIIGGGVLIDLACPAVIWASDDALRAFLLPAIDLTPDKVTISGWSLTAGAAVTAVPVALMLAVLFTASSLFKDYARGAVFTEASALRLRRIASGMIALACLQPVVRTLLVLVLTFGNPPGHRLLQVGVYSTDYMIAAFGVFLLAIGWVMAEAVRIADDNRHVI